MASDDFRGHIEAHLRVIDSEQLDRSQRKEIARAIRQVRRRQQSTLHVRSFGELTSRAKIAIDLVLHNLHEAADPRLDKLVDEWLRQPPAEQLPHPHNEHNGG